MLKIIAIEPQPRKKNQYTLTLEDGKSFSLHEEIIVRYQLKSGMEIDEEQLRCYIWEADIKTACGLALNYLGYRTRTRRQLCDYLMRKGFEQEVAEEAARRMEEYRFLDDEEYALRWIQSKKAGQPAGRRKIAYELRSKGIEQDILESALSTLTTEEERQQAGRLAEKAALKYRELPYRERLAKISQALQRRGFDWEIISRALKNISDDSRESDDNSEYEITQFND